MLQDTERVDAGMAISGLGRHVAGRCKVRDVAAAVLGVDPDCRSIAWAAPR